MADLTVSSAVDSLMQAADNAAMRTLLGIVAVEIDTAAWIEADGNNGTAALGDPARPYLTMSAAYDAGARTFFIGEGTFAGLSKSGSIDINVRGLGKTVSTITLIGSTSWSPVTVRDLGVQTCTITNVQSPGVNATLAGNGGVGGAINLANVCVSDVYNPGGLGGQSNADANDAGTGGDGGPVNITGPCFIGILSNYGGAGGSGAGTDCRGGNGGNAGAITISDGPVVGAINAYGGPVGMRFGSPGGYAIAGNGSNSVDLRMCRIPGTVDISGADADTGGSQGNGGFLVGSHIEISTLDMNGVGGPDISGKFIYVDSLLGSASVTSVLSRINGVTY